MKIVNPVGKKGEDIAVDYLQTKGYTVIERNFRKNYAELDVIALYQDTLVFIEVKSRTSDTFGLPIESISPHKIKSLIQTAQLYKLIHPTLPESMRLDAICVTFDNSLALLQIEHIENITE